MSVEVKIGIENNPRELAVSTPAAADEVQAAVAAALAGESAVLTLVDEKGAQLHVPSAKIAYVEIGSAQTHRVGFGA